MTEIEPSTPAVHLSTGEVLNPDIVIGADGYHSICQKIIERDDVADGGEATVAVDSGTVVYSMNADVTDVTPESDPEMHDFINKPVWTAFAGPYVSVLTSPSVSSLLLNSSHLILSLTEHFDRETIKK